MNKSAILTLAFLLLFTTAYAREDCLFEENWVGCDVGKPALWDCDGKIASSICSQTTGLCSAVCIENSDPFPSRSECVSTFMGTSSEFFSIGLRSWGRLSESEVDDKDPCPYQNSASISMKYVCYEEGFLGLDIFCKTWETISIFYCREVVCSGDISESYVSCEKDSVLSTSCSTTIEGSCDRKGSFCDAGSVTGCDANGNYVPIDKCETRGMECKQGTTTSALCYDPDVEASTKLCDIEGFYRCNPADMREVQLCQNGEWIYFQDCLMSCNSTGANVSATRCVTQNIEVGGCTNGNTFCHDAGESAYYFLCTNEDWLLLHKCPTPRCDINATICYSGCSLSSTFYYYENNTGYYCNIEGDWIESGYCLGEVNNITRQCELPDTCIGNSYTCSNNWVAQCVNNEWRYIEQCSYGCNQGACGVEGADIFDYVSYIADFLVLILPAISLFVSMILSASFIGYLVIKMWGRIETWIEGRP